MWCCGFCAGSNGKTDMGNSGGRFVWYELATTDTETAKAFYADVLGWGTGDSSMPGSVYTLFTAGDTPVAGLMKLPAGARRTDVAPQWIGYVAVDDVDAVAARVPQLGGTVHVPPTDVPNVSRFSVFADPQRATLALIRGRERGQALPAQREAPGHVGWHELLVSDLERTFAFYRELLGWQKADSRADAMGMYQQFSDGTETTGGMGLMPGFSTLPLWLYYFNVDNIDAAAKRVQASGGKILFGPLAVPDRGRLIQCADAQGAIFGLIDRRVRVTIGCYSARVPPDSPMR
jgi:hypothetical protein